MSIFNPLQINFPKFNQDIYGNFEYYILTEDKNRDTDCIFVPNWRNFIVSAIKVQQCFSDNLIIYNTNKNDIFVIPVHNIDMFGIPIFNNYEDSMKGSGILDCLDKVWATPENFFETKEQAEGMLNYLKKKYGVLKKFNKEDYRRISPCGQYLKKGVNNNV